MKFASLTALFVIGAALAGVVAWNAMALGGPGEPGGAGRTSLDELVRSHPAPEATKEEVGAKQHDGKGEKKKEQMTKYSKSAYDVTHLSATKIAELAKGLSPEESKVILKKGTEPAFCGNLVDNHKEGVYVCRLCGLPLFSSQHKFESGTGWPSFFQPFDAAHVAYEKDTSYGMERVEILCARCGGHLGHVFEDGPKPTNLRYCLNSVSLSFVDAKEPLPAESQPIKTATAYFAGGCFWGVEDRFQQTPGVIDAVSGYMGGKKENPTYKEVCYSDTGHAETVKVVFDPSVITYRDLVEKFFKYHDGTQLNRQGPDVGDQYRSAIFAVDDTQLAEAKSFIESKQGTGRYKTKKIVTQVESVATAGKFYEAEEYHQDYHAKHGGHCAMPPSDDE